MDQWTSRSINLLLGENLIKLDNKITVNKRKYKDGGGNTGEVYEKFCNSVDILCGEINKTSRAITPEETEQLIFSRGGHASTRKLFGEITLLKTVKTCLSNNKLFKTTFVIFYA